ncbi:MAG: hypothetical protein OXR71_11180, partial [Gemmatimonadota bacterium]|nr:hypothetical protein [Gemmatimonadota bacterium]MDE2955080.1 hypothetical protein [Gemmatimonadota bacterium]
LPYKQEVTGSNPVSPTIKTTLGSDVKLPRVFLFYLDKTYILPIFMYISELKEMGDFGSRTIHKMTELRVLIDTGKYP